MTSRTLSQEQKDVISFINEDDTPRTAILQAFAGTGKTTLLLELAKNRFEKGLGSTLLLNYSKALKEQTREVAMHQEGLFIENMHSLVRNVLWVGHECKTNLDIEQYLALPLKPCPHPAFLTQVTLVCIDEMQDLNASNYALFQQLRNFFPKKPSFVGVGDFFQWLLGSLNNSSTNYMSNASVFFPADQIRHFQLSESFRLTPQMCEWINKNLSPLRLEVQYPSTWQKYGESITRFWGKGIISAKCDQCLEVHAKEQACTPTMRYKHSQVRYLEFDSYKDGILPMEARQELYNGAATLLVNGLHTDRFSRVFSNVTTPQSFKGCEAKKGIVVACDRFVEEVCASNAITEQERLDWPFACFCQMYVSCTRALYELWVYHRKSAVSFFTMRGDDFVLPEPLTNDEKVRSNKHSSKGVRQVGKRRINHLFSFVPSDPTLDSFVADSKLVYMIPSDAPRLTSAPNSAPGTILHTVHHPFAHHYYAAIRTASYIYFTDLPRYNRMVKTQWTRFMRNCILKEHAIGISATWKADSEWCNAAMARSIELLTQTRMASDPSVEFGKAFEHVNLTGNIDFVWPWGDLLQMTFYDTYDQAKIRESWLQAMAMFICLKRTRPHMCFHTCRVANVLDGSVYEIVLNQHEDYFLGELVRRKKWDFLLDASFDYCELRFRGAAVPVSKLTQESERKQQQRANEQMRKKTKTTNQEATSGESEIDTKA